MGKPQPYNGAGYVSPDIAYIKRAVGNQAILYIFHADAVGSGQSRKPGKRDGKWDVFFGAAPIAPTEQDHQNTEQADVHPLVKLYL